MLSDKHATLSKAPALQEVCDTYFGKDSPLTYVQYLKVHKEGSVSLLTNRPDWTNFSFNYSSWKKKQLIFSCAKTEMLDKDTFWFLWDHNLPEEPVTLAREFNIAQGITFVERHKDHYLMTAFATPTHYDGALDYYYNNLENFKNFIDHFKTEHTDLVDAVEHEKIIIPKPYQDPNKDIMLLSDKAAKRRIILSPEQEANYLTRQEWECIRRLPSGKTAKEIARELEISHRTVESYFNRVMQRIGCKDKKGLIDLLKLID